jgi:hypothetical protein
MPEPETKARPARDPQALSGEYHKARKQVLLWAGILFIWELVGIDLEKAKEAGGNAGAIIIAIKSPQAVPWVLLILVAYFLFKSTVEWYQCSATRRSLRASIVDFSSAWVVSLLAYILYFGQSISQIQLADLLASNRVKSVSLGLAIGVSLVYYALILCRRYILGNIPRISIYLNIFIFVTGGVLVGILVLFYQAHWGLMLIGILVGFSLFSLPVLALRPWRRFHSWKVEVQGQAVS